MNYYVIPEEIFSTLTKNNILFCLKSIDNTKRLIATTEKIDDGVDNSLTYIILKFDTIEEFSTYTFNNHLDWVGDGTGVEIEDIENTPYIFSLDP